MSRACGCLSACSTGALPKSRDYLAEVVRKTPLANRLTGMAIKILTELGHSTAPTVPDFR